MRLSNNLLRVHVAGFEKAAVALRAAGGQGRLHEEIAALFAQNMQVAGDDGLSAAVRTAMQQIAAAVPDLPAQQASKYQNWLLVRYRQNWARQTEINPPQPLLLEDLSKYAEDLTLYHNTPNVIKKRAGISTDLFAIGSPFALYQQLKALRGEVATEFKPLTPTQQAFIDSHQAIVIGQTAQWRLVMPLTKEASQEFGAGTRWCTAAQKDNAFNEYFPDCALLYLEASGPDKLSRGKMAVVYQDGQIIQIFDADDTEQTEEQQQALLDKLPTLAAQLQNLDAAIPQLQAAIDKADFTTAFDITFARCNLALNAPIDETTLINKITSSTLTSYQKSEYLIRAASRGLSKTAQALLECGADIHAEHGEALSYAAQNGHADTVKLLIDYGADVRDYDNWALCRAAYNGHNDIVQLLLAHGADIHARNDLPLCHAVEPGHVHVVKLLLEYGANVHVYDDYAMRTATDNGYVEIVQMLEAHIAKQKATAAHTKKPVSAAKL